MKNYPLSICFVCILSLLMFSQCAEKPVENQTAVTEPVKPDFGGYETQALWGEHIVNIAGCNDCHTPKKMGDHGPVMDSTLLLSGHPAQMPPPDVNRKEMEGKGLVVTNDLTAWVGPWGISYTANLTSDATGIGNWEEATFMNAIRHGKYKGIESARTLLPPMPWETYRNMTDDELKAVFAYLKSTKPISNVVPEIQPPALAAK